MGANLTGGWRDADLAPGARKAGALFKGTARQAKAHRHLPGIKDLRTSWTRAAEAPGRLREKLGEGLLWENGMC